MAVTGRLADIAQKSAVLFLAGTTGKHPSIQGDLY